MLYINEFVLQTIEKCFFSNFELLAENQKIFKRIARREYWLKCNVLAIYQWISLDKLYKLMEGFLQIYVHKNVCTLLHF